MCARVNVHTGMNQTWPVKAGKKQNDEESKSVDAYPLLFYISLPFYLKILNLIVVLKFNARL